MGRSASGVVLGCSCSGDCCTRTGDEGDSDARAAVLSGGWWTQADKREQRRDEDEVWVSTQAGAATTASGPVSNQLDAGRARARATAASTKPLSAWGRRRMLHPHNSHSTSKASNTSQLPDPITRAKAGATADATGAAAARTPIAVHLGFRWQFTWERSAKTGLRTATCLSYGNARRVFDLAPTQAKD